ncbi:PREDICTED: uncharacterized protein LOC106314786 [Brassica oleracea var. oleracea]|uniref:uncharacterized protein LOC106314786 n=1 Tax=Brassica oleracea var. oleracea TaxID=109376 RepID=UPI0006A6D830|nr:PREDICTED: uncharacterized protein LOC106314786 [Brassica oleracea var. oleracea]
MFGNNAGDGYEQQGNRYHDMVTDALHEAAIPDSSREEPNIDAQRFYNMLDAANEPIYEGCREGLSRLSLASRMMTIKSDHNLNEKCMDSWAQLINEYLPEGNLAADNFYEIQKLVAGLGLPSEMIDVCIDNCMIYWKDDEKLTEYRLKRLYHSERTAASMRWHAQHSVKDGEITHPSDAKAWKHFQTVYSDFASEFRNVYLGLCTDGFSPFGMSGRQYSLWHVILTPYNLPPEMCMQREFLFLSILVPGPKHPKRALDVFLQPLIHELKMLWHHGVQTWDYSQQQNFNMRAVLMWTISDFPAYGMLSGWTTHERLSCPHCMDRTDAFQLKNGRKSCWFDCHRRFLPPHHTYRKNKKLFRKNKVVHVPPPVMQPGASLLEQIDYYGAKETCKVGGNWHTPPNMPDGYTASHNWHKKSIFWELPYWKDHLLRHNLDVMHIEKNVFENIMNTLLDVKGKSKDNLKSRLDLPELCARPELHVTREGKLPVPNFRLSGVAKQKLFDWAEQTGCSIPDLLGVLEITKRNPDGSFVDGKSEQLYNDVTSKFQELSQAASDDPESTGSSGLSPMEKSKIYCEFAPRKKGRLYGVGSLNTSLRSVPASFPSSSTRDQSLEKIIYDQAQKIESQGNEISKLYKIVRHLASKDSTVADILQSEDVSSASGDDDESDAI